MCLVLHQTGSKLRCDQHLGVLSLHEVVCIFTCLSYHLSRCGDQAMISRVRVKFHASSAGTLTRLGEVPLAALRSDAISRLRSVFTTLSHSRMVVRSQQNSKPQ